VVHLYPTTPAVNMVLPLIVGRWKLLMLFVLQYLTFSNLFNLASVIWDNGYRPTWESLKVSGKTIN
jgi:hypothetical protein